MIFFTADEHYFHASRSGGIIEYCNRPFKDINEMHEGLISNHNEVVKGNDTVIHAGDFSMRNVDRTAEIIERLNGKHIFIVSLKGGHDRVIRKISNRHPNMFELIPYVYELILHNKYHVTICHYCMRTWPRSHYNTWHLFAHSHCRLEAIGKSHDIGVDCNNYYPLSEDQIIDIMNDRPDNPGYIKSRMRSEIKTE